jgi:copper chaperone
MVRFAVAGISCGHCVGAITKAIQGAIKDAKVDVDLAGGRIEVIWTDNADVVRAAIEDGLPSG